MGKDSSLKLFEKYSDEEILNRMRNWRRNGHIFEEFEKKLADKNICTSCGHHGKLQAHNKAGIGSYLQLAINAVIVNISFFQDV